MQLMETRMTMKGKYPKGKYNCPHCVAGRENGVDESPRHIVESCTAYQKLREGLDRLLVLEDRIMFLEKAILKRKELERELLQ